uniref:Uncharacterized protein n=1 Tax=Kalanchoe fedtschenkoi TaxID=63787 RepID=A0A7N0RGE1_KALFE
MAAAAGDGMQFVFDSCLSGCDCGIDRRPYHRNCGCALHKSRSRGCLRRTESGCGGNKVAFPIRRAWSEGSLALAAAAGCGSSVNISPASGSSPAAEAMGRRKASLNRLVELCAEEEDEDSAV